MKRNPPKLPNKRVWALYRRWHDWPPTPEADYTLDIQALYKQAKRRKKTA